MLNNNSNNLKALQTNPGTSPWTNNHLSTDGRWSDHPLLTVVSNHIVYYPTPINLTYFWSFGSLAGMALVIQILSGVFLAMHYTPEVTLAFFKC